MQRVQVRGNWNGFRLGRDVFLKMRQSQTMQYSTTSGGIDDTAQGQKSEEQKTEQKGKTKGSILDLDNALNHCKDQVKKFDYYAFRVGQHFPKTAQPHYYALNAFFLEILKSREISKERSICQTRLHWWVHTLDDVVNDRTAREPVARMLKEVHANTQVNFKLLNRMVDY